jgi:hypothetical protein
MDAYQFLTDNQPPAATTPTTPVAPTVTPAPAPTPVVTPEVTPVPTDNESGNISARIQSFCEWSSTNTVNIFALARAGFQYTGRGDVVECFKCNGTLKEWVQEDDPLDAHNQYYPNCEFVKKRLAEVDIEKLSCGKRIADLLAATLSCVNRLKEVQKMSVSGGSTGTSTILHKLRWFHIRNWVVLLIVQQAAIVVLLTT